jgi:hypothetical protein
VPPNLDGVQSPLTDEASDAFHVDSESLGKFTGKHVLLTAY